ncbi:hypothetical protein Tco_1314764 [Tanacetum coccineum]
MTDALVAAKCIEFVFQLLALIVLAGLTHHPRRIMRILGRPSGFDPTNFFCCGFVDFFTKYSSSVKLLHVPFISSNVGPANNSGVSVVTFSRFITKAEKSNVVSVSSSNDSQGSCLLARLLRQG